MNNLQLRPQNYAKRRIYRFRNAYGNYDWVAHKTLEPRSVPLNEWFMGRVMFARIHYLTSHAPDAIQKRWKQAEARWKQKQCYTRASMRFLSKFTIDRWL